MSFNRVLNAVFMPYVQVTEERKKDQKTGRPKTVRRVPTDLPRGTSTRAFRRYVDAQANEELHLRSPRVERTETIVPQPASTLAPAAPAPEPKQDRDGQENTETRMIVPGLKKDGRPREQEEREDPETPMIIPNRIRPYSPQRAVREQADDPAETTTVIRESKGDQHPKPRGENDRSKTHAVVPSRTHRHCRRSDRSRTDRPHIIPRDDDEDEILAGPSVIPPEVGLLRHKYSGEQLRPKQTTEHRKSGGAWIRSTKKSAQHRSSKELPDAPRKSDNAASERISTRRAEDISTDHRSAKKTPRSDRRSDHRTSEKHSTQRVEEEPSRQRPTGDAARTQRRPDQGDSEKRSTSRTEKESAPDEPSRDVPKSPNEVKPEAPEGPSTKQVEDKPKDQDSDALDAEAEAYLARKPLQYHTYTYKTLRGGSPKLKSHEYFYMARRKRS